MKTHRDVLAGAYGGKSVAVTGGLSFIGSHLVELLELSGASVTVVDDLSSGKMENLPDNPRRSLYIGDLRDAQFASRVLGAHDTVFHLAAAHGGRGYIETHPVECMNNMVLDHIVYAAAAAGGVRRIVTASSACAYPTTLQSSAADRMLLAEPDANFEVPGAAFADGEYGWAKLMSEQQLHAFHKQYGID
ncbi:MAG: NAD-dependent epimerase/dehydratase family protein, partial [Acidimicrobiales bacterium]